MAEVASTPIFIFVVYIMKIFAKDMVFMKSFFIFLYWPMFF